MLARYDDQGAVTGGAVVSGDGPCGVSNLFARTADPGDIWRGVLATLPQTPLVGYESEPDLPPAREAGFTPAGPLRVWLRD
ncbi:hypothetical protein GCM10027614_12810 [Micromonospora vulcania]